jgi:hypothetical protein
LYLLVKCKSAMRSIAGRFYDSFLIIYFRIVAKDKIILC